MLVEVGNIKVVDRIRKDFGNIEELADDIKENGLINPPVVTPDLQLIAGERRLRACKHLGWEQIEVRVMTVRDYEHQLKMEISENENRKEFTFSERVDWARRLERVEKEKARERQGERTDIKENFPESEHGQTRDIVAEQSGFGSGKQYEKAKYIAENADAETIAKLDAGEISIHKAYMETKAKLQEAERKASEFERQANEIKRKASELERENERLLAELEDAHVKTEVIEKVVEKVVEKPVYHVPDDVKRELSESKTRLSKAESERGKLEAALAEQYGRIRELEQLERSVRSQQESPLYDIYRASAALNGYLKTFIENDRLARDVLSHADRGVLDKLLSELRSTVTLADMLERMSDEETGVVVIDGEQNNYLEVI
ncbi:ParB N-terminal domain-containing protein [Aneurinibacillus aneurinilyticus]|uniref:ParB N-terminal domain-containing protein n=1 Tax=Aneurinibacillus aneurinilyticus TaxID=1391 RepID=UPI0023EFDEF8|nr:ParB N-terminal domain-containing protein [Aneurinibacillus aneurinilyticus]